MFETKNKEKEKEKERIINSLKSKPKVTLSGRQMGLHLSLIQIDEIR